MAHDSLLAETAESGGVQVCRFEPWLFPVLGLCKLTSADQELQVLEDYERRVIESSIQLLKENGLQRIYSKPLYKLLRSSRDFIKAVLIYLKNYFQRTDRMVK